MGRPMLWRYERMASSMGYLVVAGVDEVGMGPLAGPVVGGAVVLPIGVKISGLDDSKLIRFPARERAMIEYDRMYPGYGFAGHKGYATRAHRSAILRLGPSPIHRTTWAPFRAFISAAN